MFFQHRYSISIQFSSRRACISHSTHSMMSTVQSQIEKKFEIHVKEHPGELLQHINSAWKERRLCDFLIKVGSKEIPVHKIVLSESSDYFKAMFSHKMKEAESGVVEMEGIDPESLLICIEFMYTGKVSVLVSKIEEFIQVADLLQLTKLYNAATAYLEENLDEPGFFKTRNLAKLYNCQQLQKKCDEFALKNFEGISKEEGFLCLDRNYLESLLKSEENKANDSCKMNAFLKWIKSDSSNRAEYFMKFVGLVDLTKLSLEYRRYLIQTEPLINSSAECLRLISESLFDSVGATARSYEDENRSPVIAIFEMTTQHLQLFDPVANTWKQTQKLTPDMEDNFCSAVLLNGYIYVMVNERKMYRLNISDRAANWKRMADLIKDHGFHPPVAVLRGCLYVAGGYGYSLQTNSAEKYEPMSDKWTKIPNTNMTKNGCTAIAVRGYLYSIGGFSQNGQHNKVERFDPESSSWTYVAPMNEVKDVAAAVEFNSKIFVLGGYNGKTKATVERYDPELNSWTTLRNMLTPRRQFEAHVIGNSIYAVGGYESRNSIEKYDVETDQWMQVSIPEEMNIKIYSSVKI